MSRPALSAGHAAEQTAGHAVGHAIAPAQAARLVRIAHEASGITFGPGKIDFLRGRLTPRLEALGCRDFDAYLNRLESAEGETERQHLVEALTTHTTSFFRESRHFDWLRTEGLAALISRGIGVERDLVLWSAACSTGAELWTASMLLASTEVPGGAPLAWQGVGSDISTKILRRASTAIFSEEEVARIPEDLRRRFLLRSRAGGEGGTADSDGVNVRASARARYKIVPELRARCRLLQMNLLALEGAPRFTADVVLLRNVLIYFSQEDQHRVASAVAARLAPGGFLLTGHAEPLRQTVPGLRAVDTAIYTKTG
ncbi:MAG: CheR family methyltransferase [Pseudomonadota bacterium]